MEKYIADEAAMEALGAALAGACSEAVPANAACQIHLRGDLGAGKTTLVRGFLRALGHQGSVKSPTYTLIEPYEFEQRPIYHLDLYRLSHPGELEYLGLRDLQERGSIFLVEWPDQGAGELPPADVQIEIRYALPGRQVRLEAASGLGSAIIAHL
jgi:tRNA threonylcarbamoyladenosine biosynthesis protein TsaE